MSVLASALVTLLCGGASLHAAYPTVSRIQPCGTQVGTEFSMTLTGTNLGDFDSLMFYTPGMSLKKVESVEDTKVVCQVAVDSTVIPGNHVIRVVTKSGISHGRQFFVGHYPTVEEKEPNNSLDLAQAVALNQTVEGVVQTEDVDYFKVTLKKGERISVETEGLRLGYTLFDPYVAILDGNRFEKVASDDTILHKQDGYCTWEADEDGDYYVMMRESSYRGGATSFYRLHIGDFRRPDVVYPAGAKAGSKLSVQFIESDGDAFAEEIEVAAEGGAERMLFSSTQKPAPSGNPMRVVAFDNTLEVEPNATREQATPVTFADGAALNGIIQEPGDVDYFKIALKKGQKLQIEAFGQSLGSPIDTVVGLYDGAGKSVASNDDGGGDRRLDSKVNFDVAADGDYFVRVGDHLERGGPTFVYRIEVQSKPQSVSISSPFFTNNDSHYRQFVPVPKGGRFAALVNVVRTNVAGEFVFKPEGLPAGVTLLTPGVPKDLTSVPLLFEAAPDAVHGNATVPIHLVSTDEAVKVRGGVKQLFEIVRLGVVVYHTEFHDRLPVAVVDEAPYSLEIVKPSAPLVAGGTMDLTVKAVRKEGFDAPIRVLMVWKPPGISALGERTIPKDGTECVFALSADGSVKAGEWDFTVLGEADGGKGRLYNASPFCRVTTAPPFVGAETMALTAVEQGQEAVMMAKIEPLVAFKGEALARVVGLPESIPVEPVKITSETKEALFKVTTTDKSPVGKQSNLFVQVEVPTENGAVSIHRIATGSTLRIDAPRKVEAAKVAAAPKEEPKKEVTKPLSRLEQLRQEAALAGAQK